MLGLRQRRPGAWAVETHEGQKPGTSPSRQRSALHLLKILSEPSSGKRGNIVAFISRYGQCQREYLIPKNTVVRAGLMHFRAKPTSG